MKSRTIGMLVVAGAVVLAAGWYFGPRSQPGEQQTIDAGRLMFPGLAPKLAEATQIQIEHQGKALSIRKQNGAWGLVERGGYPVQADKLHGILTALTELRLLEPRTSDPAEFGRLGLDDPGKPASGGSLVRIDDAGGTMAAVIVGHSRSAISGDAGQQVYVRRPDEKRTWLADGPLQVDTDPMQWLPREIVNIDHARIASIGVERAGQPGLSFAGKEGKLAITQPAEHPPLDQAKVDDLVRGLEQVSFEDVRPAAQEPAGTPIGQSVFTTTDGLAVTVRLQRADKDLWARFMAAGSGAAQPEAAKLNARLASWSYELGSWKEAALVPALDALKAPAPPPKAAPPPSSTVPTQ